MEFPDFGRFIAAVLFLERIDLAQRAVPITALERRHLVDAVAALRRGAQFVGRGRRFGCFRRGGDAAGQRGGHQEKRQQRR
ncbi:MAG: hypothetical protein LBR05_08995 [Azoarcus sp.]|nr:hypothetical protein [Azoarcus sp.]